MLYFQWMTKLHNNSQFWWIYEESTLMKREFNFIFHYIWKWLLIVKIKRFECGIDTTRKKLKYNIFKHVMKNDNDDNKTSFGLGWSEKHIKNQVNS